MTSDKLFGWVEEILCILIFQHLVVRDIVQDNDFHKQDIYETKEDYEEAFSAFEEESKEEYPDAYNLHGFVIFALFVAWVYNFGSWAFFDGGLYSFLISHGVNFLYLSIVDIGEAAAFRKKYLKKV